MKKNHKYRLFIAVLSFTYLGIFSHAKAAYTDEGTAFYTQTSPSGYVSEGTAFYTNGSQTNGTTPVYRFYNTKTGDHFYTASQADVDTINNHPEWNYKLENTAFYASTTQVSDSLPVYRFYNSNTGDHFYTISQSDVNIINNNPQWGYSNEGIVFYAYQSQISGTVPVYRFFNGSNGDHFYTISEDEKNQISLYPVYRFYNIKNGDHFYTVSQNDVDSIKNHPEWNYLSEGIVFYASINQISNASPVYRFYNTKNGDHFYTISQSEVDTINSNPQWGYTAEGTAFYAYTSQVSGTVPIYRLYNTDNGKHFYTASSSEYNYLLTSGLGPDISVGLWPYSKADIMNSPFQIDANKTYNVRDVNGNILTQVSGNTSTYVSYNDNQNQLTVTVGSLSKTLAGTTVTFDAADGNNTSLIFDTHRSNYIASDWRGTIDHYRGKIKVQYYRGPDVYGGNPGSTITQIWVDNVLPLEEYAWGSAETSGTGPLDHTKVMETIYRTYGYWYIKYSTKYAGYGFQIRSDSGSQNYGGYDWENNHPNIKTAAQQTRAVIVAYGGDVALTPYSSWSAGQTRSAVQAWGSNAYPWCQSISDSYGNYNDSYFNNSSTMTQAQLISAGNHMVGLIAHGSLHMANVGWGWQDILKHYYQGIYLPTNY